MRILATVLLSMCVSAAGAQSNSLTGIPIEIDQQTMDLIPTGSEPRPIEIHATEYEGFTKSAGVTEETVGDPYSFGREKTYLGVVQTRPVSLKADCTGHPPEAGPCVELLPAPTVTNVFETDLGRIELPGRSTKSLLCFTFTPFSSWQWFNGTGSQQMAEMSLRPFVRIESDVLLDPSLIDPRTGMPYNGVLLESTITTSVQMRSLYPNESDSQFQATTRSCTAGLVNIRALRESFGLSDRVIRDLFRNPITIEFGAYGDVSMVTDASFSVGVRLYGD